MQRVVLAAAVFVAALGQAASAAAQGLPPGGYYAGGAYYVPNEPPASAAAPAATDRPSACPLGYDLPTMYVAITPTMIRIYQFWPIGGDAPGFPYVPVYASQPQC